MIGPQAEAVLLRYLARDSVKWWTSQDAEHDSELELAHGDSDINYVLRPCS
jgi:hypothetical protein